MRPTDDEIRRTAYERWERRGWSHGADRDDWQAAETDLTFRISYRTIVEHILDGHEPMVLGIATVPRCRFCERKVNGGAPRPLIIDHPALMTREVCKDCQSDWRGALDEELRGFWWKMGALDLHNPGPRSGFTVAAFKAMTACALLIMPGTELRYFVDALEWVSNPDHDADDRLLDVAECRVHRADFLGFPPRLSLARRVDDDDPIPYMTAFLEWNGIMVQAPVPMCLRDEDLDGRAVEHPGRLPSAGWGHSYREAWGVVLPLSVSTRRNGRSARLAALAG